MRTRDPAEFVLWESTVSTPFKLLGRIENGLSKETLGPAEGPALGTKLENPQRVMKGEQQREIGKKVRRGNGKKVLRSALQSSSEYKHRTTQTCFRKQWQHFECFWMGFLFKFSHHSFHYHYYLYSIVEFLFSLLFLFPYVILTQSYSVFFFLRGRACRKAWCCTW